MSDKPKKKSSKWGYGKTDPATHWKKGGPSPNPKGRPKGSKNQKTLWKEASAIKAKVLLEGKSTTITQKELRYMRLSLKAGDGDLKAIAMANELDARFDPGETIPPTKEESAADYATLSEWVKLKETFKVFGEPDEREEKDGGGEDG